MAELVIPNEEIDVVTVDEYAYIPFQNFGYESALTNDTDTSSSNSSSYGENDVQRRRFLNDKERQRRIDLSIGFEELRRLVPMISYKENVSQSTILREAAAFCELLKDVNRNDTRKVVELLQEQQSLKLQIEKLRKSLVAKCRKNDGI